MFKIAADEDVNMIFGTVINPELQDEIVVTVIATGFEDKPSSQGRKATSTGFGSSVNSSSSNQSHATLKKTHLLQTLQLALNLQKA